MEIHLFTDFSVNHLTPDDLQISLDSTSKFLKKIWLDKQKFVSAALLHMLLAGGCKAANSGVSSIFFGNDWL